VIRKVLFNILFLLIFILISFRGITQEVLRKSYYFEKALNYNSFPEDSRGSQIISLLASNNITSLYWVNINIKADLQVQLNKADYGQLSANIILQDYSLDGETHFRDFSIDSLLMPDLIEGNIDIYYAGKKLISQPWLIAVRTGFVSMYIPDSVQFDENRLKIVLDISSYGYSDERYNAFVDKTNLINAYYAFTRVLKDMLERFEKKGLNKSELPSYLFLSWEEIQRVNNYIYNYQFYKQLNLDGFDPAGFLSLYDQSIRLQRRATTLKNSVGESNSVNGIIEDKRKFCRDFALISSKYLEMAGEHQPYIASGFSEVARIITSEQEKDMLGDASKFYDVFTAVDDENTPQMIYNKFVELADSALTHKKYVATLDLLYNANLMPEWFEVVKRSPQYENIYIEAIDGLVSSYLKVATMAYRSESYLMAEIYYQKAINVYQLHHDNVGNKKIASAAFLSFIKQQTEVSYKMIDDKEYFRAVELLTKAKEISEEQQLSQSQIKIDSAFRLSYAGIYDNKLDSIQQLLDEHQPDKALQAMDQTQTFSEHKNEYLQNINRLHFSVLAQALFDNYYQKGMSLLKSENAENALFSFLKAKRISDNYLEKTNKELDSMIYFATVPVILNIVNKAEFEVWANHTEKAKEFLTEALSYQTKYELLDNAEVNKAIDSLRYKIKTRHCTNLSNECFAIGKRAITLLNLKKYLQAEALLKKGKEILENYPYCSIDGDKINSLWDQYEDAFVFYNIVEKINQNLEKKQYSVALGLFIELDDHFNTDNIKRFGIEEPDIFQFVQNQNNPKFSFAATRFFIKSDQFEKAFLYLQLLEQQNVTAKETKNLQIEIGKGLANKSPDYEFENKALKSKLEGKDKWYRNLRKAYSNKSLFFINIFTRK